MRIKINNIDRYGLLYDVSKLLFENNLNILSMEVKRNVIYLETAEIPAEQEKFLLQKLKEIANIDSIEKILLMPYEKNSEFKNCSQYDAGRDPGNGLQWLHYHL